jgi:hypothetical protein
VARRLTKAGLPTAKLDNSSLHCDLKDDGAAIAVIPSTSAKANEDVMAKEDRLCAFCGTEIRWNEEFSMENGQEFHVAPRGCWAEYLRTKAHQERDGEDRQDEK